MSGADLFIFTKELPKQQNLSLVAEAPRRKPTMTFSENFWSLGVTAQQKLALGKVISPRFEASTSPELTQEIEAKIRNLGLTFREQDALLPGITLKDEDHLYRDANETRNVDLLPKFVSQDIKVRLAVSDFLKLGPDPRPRLPKSFSL